MFSDDLHIIEKFHVRPFFGMLTVEPDAVSGVTRGCDGVVTMVEVTTAGRTGGGTVGGAGRGRTNSD